MDREVSGAVPGRTTGTQPGTSIRDMAREVSGAIPERYQWYSPAWYFYQGQGPGALRVGSTRHSWLPLWWWGGHGGGEDTVVVCPAVCVCVLGEDCDGEMCGDNVVTWVPARCPVVPVNAHTPLLTPDNDRLHCRIQRPRLLLVRPLPQPSTRVEGHLCSQITQTE